MERAFANHGGEAILTRTSLVASGYHQDAEASGFRSVLIRLKGITIHLITCYFDDGCSLDDAANTEKAHAISNLIRAIKLPWLLIGDFNVPPEECGSSMFFAFLGGIILAPNVEYTCYNSNGVSRVLDYGIASVELAKFIELEPIYNHPFKPHIVGIKFKVHIEADLDMGWIQRTPKEIPIAAGPRNSHDTWWWHFNKQQDFFPSIQAPWAQGADRIATIQYARWARAAESYLLSTCPQGYGDPAFMGRGSIIEFEISEGVLTSSIDHI